MTATPNAEDRQLILFDLDGTLVDSAPDLYRSMNLTLQACNRPSVTLQQVREWVGRGAAQLCRCVLQYQDQYCDEQQQQQLLQLFLDTYQQNLCVDTVLYDGVMEFLDYCRQSGKIIACVTNKPYRAAVGLLQQLQIEQRFALILGGDSLPQRKPQPEPLLHAVRQLQQRVEQTLMIGDSRNDVEAARNAGMDCIALSYGYNHGEDIRLCRPQRVIDNLRELIPN